MADSLILTTAGLAKLAIASPESPVQISHLAVGDGNGGYPAMAPSWTALAHEVWRGTASEPIREPGNPTVLKFETVIPSDDGGFFIRELGLFDSTGTLIAVAQCSVVEKPGALSSTALTMTVAMRLTLANAAQTQVVVSDSPYIDHGGLSGRNNADAHPMAAITGLTGKQSFNTTEALSLPATIAGAVSLKSTAYNMRAILPKVSNLQRAVELTLYLSHDSTHPVMVRAATGDTLNMPDDVKYDSVPDEIILRPTGGWVTLRSVAGTGWEVVASNIHLRDPNTFKRGMPFVASTAEIVAGEDGAKMVSPSGLAAWQSPETSGVATITGIDNKLVLAGVVSAINLEKGDVVRVVADGITYNKLHTVESVTGTGELILNYEHCAGRGNGPLKLPDYTGPVTITRIAKWFNASEGLGQERVDLTALRAVGVPHPNTSGRTVKTIVIDTGGASTSGVSLVMTVDGDIVSSHSDGGSENRSRNGTVSYDVKNGAQVSVTSARAVLKWWEIR